MISRKILLTCMALLSTVACSTVRAGGGGGSDGEARGGTVITASAIERSQARNAMEALERSRHHLTIREPGSGRAPVITARGIGSFLLHPQMVVVVDGSYVSDPVGMLRSIPAPSILWIQILTGREATTVYGTSAGNGAIVVATGASRER